MLINIDIVNKHPQVDGTPVIVCGNSGYQIKFNFDDEWSGLTYKTARFVYVTAGKPTHIDVPFTGDTVDVPRLTEITFVLVGVYTDAIKTTTPARIACEYSIRCNSGENVEEPTPELYDQLLEMFNRVGQFQDAAIQAAETATEANEEAQVAAQTAREAIGQVVSRVVEHNGGNYVTFWVGTTAEYETIETKETNCLYILTDDTTSADLLAAVTEMQQDCYHSAAAATAAAASAAAAAASAKGIDVSDKITIEIVSGEANMVATLGNKKFVYNPATGVVFYQIEIIATGTASGTQFISLLNRGSYLASGNAMKLYGAATANSGGDNIAEDAYYMATKTANGFDYDQIRIYPKATSGTGVANLSVFVTGWYFCDGEE